MNTISVEGKKYSVVKEFNIIHIGWECDNTGYIVDINGKMKLVLTSHGKPYFAKNKELEDKINEYQMYLKESKDALSLIYNQNNKD
jgi:hypothetical protein